MLTLLAVPRFSENFFVKDPYFDLRFYASCPLVASNGKHGSQVVSIPRTCTDAYAVKAVVACRW